MVHKAVAYTLLLIAFLLMFGVIPSNANSSPIVFGLALAVYIFGGKLEGEK